LTENVTSLPLTDAQRARARRRTAPRALNPQTAARLSALSQSGGFLGIPRAAYAGAAIALALGGLKPRSVPDWLLVSVLASLAFF
jgi:cyanate permease